METTSTNCKVYIYMNPKKLNMLNHQTKKHLWQTPVSLGTWHSSAGKNGTPWRTVDSRPARMQPPKTSTDPGCPDSRQVGRNAALAPLCTWKAALLPLLHLLRFSENMHIVNNVTKTRKSIACRIAFFCGKLPHATFVFCAEWTKICGQRKCSVSTRQALLT